MNNLPYILADAVVTAAPEGAAPAPAETVAQTVQPADDNAAAPAPQPGQPPSPWMNMLPFVLIFALFYFMMIRPQQRKEKARRKMIDELRAGAKVIFAHGIFGTIVEANEKTFVIQTTEGRMEVLRGSVEGVVESEAATTNN
ncbi:MAG: preprotein translocase subunit YajC [Kiritimatiellia bacterium]